MKKRKKISNRCKVKSAQRADVQRVGSDARSALEPAVQMQAVVRELARTTCTPKEVQSDIKAAIPQAQLATLKGT